MVMQTIVEESGWKFQLFEVDSQVRTLNIDTCIVYGTLPIYSEKGRHLCVKHSGLKPIAHQ